MKVQLISYPSNADQLCGTASAICTNYNDSHKALIGALASGHESVIEHASYSFRISGISRVTLAQLTRHRIASFSVESQRYCDQAENGFVMPKTLTYEQRGKAEVIVNMCKLFYQTLIEEGVDKEDARYFLPEGSETRLVMTMNARELKHFLKLRTCNRAQWEIRKMAEEMFYQVYKTAPALFDGAFCGCVNGKCPQGRKCCGHDRKADYIRIRDESINSLGGGIL